MVSPTQSNHVRQFSASAGVIDLKTDMLRSESLTRTALRRLSRDYLTLAAIGVLVFFTVISYAAPLIAGALDLSYVEPSSARQFLGVGESFTGPDGVTRLHPFGTDHLGRDVLTRVLYGGRVSISIGVAGAFFSTIIGVSIGLLAGYYTGGALRIIDDLVMWFISTLNAIPTLMLLILLASVLSPSVPTLIFVLTLVSWTGTMRLIRGETIVRRENEYVVSARAMGARPLRIMFIHILPNTISVLVTALAIQIGNLILIESALSFLNLGVRQPEPSWGNMLTNAQAHFRQGPHLSIIPGLMIVSTVLSLYLIGDGLRDAFDPTNRNK